MWKSEVELVEAEEPNRLLRCKIKYHIYDVVDTQDQFKALRLIRLNALATAGIFELSDREICALLLAETRNVFDGELDIVSNNKELIFIDISQ